jgi:hypothetical protein
MVLDLHLNVHVHSVLLVDVSLPHLDGQLLVRILCLISDKFVVAVRDNAKVIDHLSKNANLFSYDFFIFLDQGRVLIDQSV